MAVGSINNTTATGVLVLDTPLIISAHTLSGIETMPVVIWSKQQNPGSIARTSVAQHIKWLVDLLPTRDRHEHWCLYFTYTKPHFHTIKTLAMVLGSAAIHSQ